MVDHSYCFSRLHRNISCLSMGLIRGSVYVVMVYHVRQRGEEEEEEEEEEERGK